MTITNEIKKLCEVIINDEPINKDTLGEEIFNHLLSLGIIYQVNNEYKLTNVAPLFSYQIELSKNKQVEKANRCLTKCYEINPNHYPTLMQLLGKSILNEQYDLAITYIENMYNSSIDYAQDCNLYLYLLSFLTELPSKYKDMVKNIQLKDIAPNETFYKATLGQEKNIRIKLLNQKFVYAKSLISDLIKSKGNKVQLYILSSLTMKNIFKQKEINDTVLKLVINKEYQELKNFLTKIGESSKLNRNNLDIITICDLLLKANNGEMIVETETGNFENYSEAINNGNYKLALKLSQDYINQYNIDPNTNPIYLLLFEINNIITMQKNTIKENAQKNQSVEAESNTKPMSDTYSQIAISLINKNFDDSFKLIKDYLKSTNKENYESLIINLAKLSILQKDITFSETMSVLAYVNRDNFTFNVSKYLGEFYERIAQNRLEEAKIYLDILSSSNNIGQEFVLTDGLTNLLNNIKTLNNQKADQDSSSNQMQSKMEEQKQPIINEPPIIENTTDISQDDTIEPLQFEEQYLKDLDEEKESPLEVEESTIYYSEKEEYLNQVREFVQYKYEELLNTESEFIELEDFTREEISDILEIVNEYPDLKGALLINSFGKDTVFLRLYKKFNKKELQTLKNKYAEAKTINDYATCIDCGKQILQYQIKNISLYADVGINYLKLHNNEEGLKFLTLANNLSRKYKTKYDYTTLISTISTKYAELEEKCTVKVNVNEFYNRALPNYGINNFNEIKQRITQDKLSIEEVCKSFNLDENEQIIVNILMAQDLYHNADYKTGDIYLNKAEKTKGKSQYIIDIINETRKNKLFYKNR